MWADDLPVQVLQEFTEAGRIQGTDRRRWDEALGKLRIVDVEKNATRSREDARKYRARLAKDPEALARRRAKKAEYERARYARLRGAS